MSEATLILIDEFEKALDYKGYGCRAANRRGQEWLDNVEEKADGNQGHRWNHGKDKQTKRPKKGRNTGKKGYRFVKI